MEEVTLYILQESLFSFEDLLKMHSKDRLPIFFSTLDLRPYAKELRSRSPRGADGHCREGILRALLAASLEYIQTFTGLHHRLDTDLRFRYQCGLPLDREAPSIATLSRVFADLTKKDLAKQLFDDLVERCRQDGIIDGSHVAIDSAAIHAYEKKQPKKKSNRRHAYLGDSESEDSPVSKRHCVTSFCVSHESSVQGSRRLNFWIQ